MVADASAINSLLVSRILSPQANLYPQSKRGDLVRITHWLISIVKRPWNRADVSKTSANEDYEDTYYLLNYKDNAIWHS